MKNPLRNLPYFTSGERRGILALCILILVVMCIALPDWDNVAPGEQPTPEQQEAYRAFRDRLQQEEQATASRYDSHRGNAPYTPARETPLTPFPFDPNRADSATLRRLGLPGWMARNVVRYREKGGRFRRAEDFRRIYGLTDEQYEALRPYVRLASADTLRPEAQPLWAAAGISPEPAPSKYPAGTVVDLNRADTNELKRIPGIGSALARRIADYRRQLGGYCRVEQLAEIRLDAQRLRPWFRVDTAAVRRIDLNNASLSALARHPYLNFYQARAIVDWRQRHGRLNDLKPLALCEEFTDADLRRLAHYVRFE